ncbi:hypothetical protein YA0027_14295 [Pseudomonas syringae]|nr:hypothetical protein [Pseudomonas syringae]MBI6824243.1 hypothetical protein [Pseudomonas syringae]
MGDHVYQVVDDAGDVDIQETPPKPAGRFQFGAVERASDVTDASEVSCSVETGSLLSLRWKLAPGW